MIIRCWAVFSSSGSVSFFPFFVCLIWLHSRQTAWSPRSGYHAAFFFLLIPRFSPVLPGKVCRHNNSHLAPTGYVTTLYQLHRLFSASQYVYPLRMRKEVVVAHFKTCTKSRKAAVRTADTCLARCCCANHLRPQHPQTTDFPQWDSYCVTSPQGNKFTFQEDKRNAATAHHCVALHIPPSKWNSSYLWAPPMGTNQSTAFN